MGAVVTPQLIDVVDTITSVRNYPSGTRHHLTTCRVEHWGLRTESATPDDPFTSSEVSWVLPAQGIRIQRRRPRSRHARSGPTLLTAIRVTHDHRSWRTTDLLLGLALQGRRTPRIVNSAEFAAAVTGRVLRAADAELALRTVHRTLEEISEYHHDLGSWLLGLGITRSLPGG
ncbi:hypothetical protein C1701_03750 [Actinoalloteichus sp. AHMU CJ021]|uniref:hypothetical protein n=1 Tax=Actinoalloteichus TaxID=65496 RepID=UPI00047BA4FC|nr:hypothetical protein [Actinoalloteichus caeruleus]AUS77630.1 hypothetical protein C1701_03750 [Actinoalloteichus sp. AHMU CJ021]